MVVVVELSTSGELLLSCINVELLLVVVKFSTGVGRWWWLFVSGGGLWE